VPNIVAPRSNAERKLSLSGNHFFPPLESPACSPFELPALACDVSSGETVLTIASVIVNANSNLRM
jgi:hypothetical protein